MASAASSRPARRSMIATSHMVRKQQIVRQPHLEGAAEEPQRFLLPLGLQQPAGQADQVGAVARRRRLPASGRRTARSPSGRPATEYRWRCGGRSGPPERPSGCAENRSSTYGIISPGRSPWRSTPRMRFSRSTRRQLSRRSFQRRRAPKSRSRCSMRSNGCRARDHAEAGFEQRLVVGLAVVGDQHVELRQVLGEAVGAARPLRRNRA